MARYFFSQFLSLIDRLSLRPRIGGLQISDSALQYVLVGEEVRSASLRMPPEVVKGGRVVDAEQCLALLQQLYQIINAGKRERVVPVVVVLPASIVYTQSFTIPNVGEEKMREAAALNLQMISPMPRDSAYMSWQKIGEDLDQYELLGAFAEKAVVDQYRELLERANFSPVAFEFPGLALARAISETMNADPVSTVLFQVSSDGLDLAIVRNNHLYFDYFRSWRSIQGDNREIPRSVFEQTVVQEVRKVVNFALGRFKETPRQVLLIAPGFEQEMQALIAQNFGFPVVSLELGSWPLTSHWYVALGSALRGRMSRNRDRFISVAPVSSRRLFREEQTVNFIWLWRNVLTVVLGVFLLFYAGVAYFLAHQVSGLEQHLTLLRGGTYGDELRSLEVQAGEFNVIVATAKDARVSASSWTEFLDKIRALASARNITIDRLEISSLQTLVTLTARATSNAGVLEFKNALVNSPDFTGVDLPVSKITALSDNSVGFTVTFVFRG